jgi:hypothetical protein
VDRDDAVSRLPATYQRVIDMLGEGVTPADIARELGVEPDAASTLIALTTAKFARAAQEPRE